MTDDAQEKSLRERSGDIRHASPVVSFLYDLVRDHVPAGVIETIVTDALQAPKGTEYAYSNGWLAQYAVDVAERLLGGLAREKPDALRIRSDDPPICCDAMKVHVHRRDLKWQKGRGYIIRPVHAATRFILHLCPWCGVDLPYDEDFGRTTHGGEDNG